MDNSRMHMDLSGILDRADGPVLFLLDARNKLERRQLEDWIDGVLRAQKRNLDISRIALPISVEKRMPSLADLAVKLQENPKTIVVPLRISWLLPAFSKNKGIPFWYLLFGDPRAPGYLGYIRSKWILFRDPTRAHCFSGVPATVEAMQEKCRQTIDKNVTSQEFARFVIRQASIALDIAERDFRGSRYKVPRFIADSLKADQRFTSAVTQLAIASGKPVAALSEQADRYMTELIAKPTTVFIDMKARLERFLLSLGYADKIVVDPQEVERFRHMVRNNPTLVLFTHKTYLDGMAATDIAYRNDMPLIHTFGGANMAMPGLSTMMRGSGGIFIRRSFKDNYLYKLVLRHYISYLLEKRFPMTWAFEGTRSRTGKLMPPRFGLLKYVVDAAHSNNVENLHFLPVSTSFDLIRDVDDYVAEQAGSPKPAETLLWFLGYMRSLKKPRGRIYVNFGEPVVVPKAPDPEDKLALAKIAFEVAVRANRVTPFTLNSLMCMILLGAAPRGMTADQMDQAIDYFVEWGNVRGIRMADALRQKDHGVREEVQTLLDSGLFLRYDHGPQIVYAVEPSKHPVVSYYRNTIIHHFLDRAIIELALLKVRERPCENIQEAFWSEAFNLRDLFKFEFFYPEKEEFRTNLEVELGRIDEHWRELFDDARPQLDKLVRRCAPLVGHAVFLPIVEAYKVVATLLTGLKVGDEIGREECVMRAVKEGRFAYLMRSISSEASIAKAIFDNGYSLAEHKGLTGVADDKKIGESKVLLRELRGLLRRMEESRILSLRATDTYFEVE